MLRSAFATPFSMLTLLAGLLAGPVTSTLAADSSLVYSPVAPCRIFDTRNTGGPIAAGTSEDFYVYGDATTMFGQGGNPAGCPAPQGEPIAVHLNITVVPFGDGHIRVYPKGTALPNASTVNYKSGVNVANAVTVKTTFDPADLDLSVYSSNNAHVLADVQGYYYPKLKNVITVSAQYADFTNPIDALNAIPTTGPNVPSATNPYVIQIGPGTYDLGSNQLIMRQWVDIKGTGSREATVITGAVSAGVWGTDSALLVGASNAELTDLTIINTGSGTITIAIANNGASPKIRRVKARALGSTNNVGVYNENADPLMSNTGARGAGGLNNNFGVYNTNASPNMKFVTAEALGTGSSNNYGVYNAGGSSTPVMSGLIANAGAGVGQNEAISIVSGASPSILFSWVNGAGSAIDTDNTSSAKVSSSTLIGGATGVTANNSCIYVADENNDPLDANCLAPPP
jgi:hypothetical protein